eukprot:1147590-Pelagomonas_calceolata.AAC.3
MTGSCLLLLGPPARLPSCLGCIVPGLLTAIKAMQQRLTFCQRGGSYADLGAPCSYKRIKRAFVAYICGLQKPFWGGSVSGGSVNEKPGVG